MCEVEGSLYVFVFVRGKLVCVAEQAGVCSQAVCFGQVGIMLVLHVQCICKVSSAKLVWHA